MTEGLCKRLHKSKRARCLSLLFFSADSGDGEDDPQGLENRWAEVDLSALVVIDHDKQI